MNWKPWVTSIFILALLLITLTDCTRVTSVDLRQTRAATHFRDVDFAPDSDIAWAVGFNGAILKTTNAGKTWQPQHSGTTERLYGLQVIDKKTAWVCGTNGTLITTDNGGKFWRKIPIPSRLRILDVYFVNPSSGWIAGDNGYIAKTDDAGTTWTQQTTNVQSGFRRIWFSDTRNGFAIGYEGTVLKTTQGGDHWKKLDTPENMSIYGASFQESGNVFHLVGSCGTILESTDSGATTRILPILTTNFLRDVDFTGNGHGAVAGYGVLLYFDPQVGQWIRGQTVSNIYLQGIALNSRGSGIAVGRWGSILLSSDNGKTWKMNTEMFAPDLYAIAGNENIGYIAAGADGWTLINQPGSTEWLPEYSGLRYTIRSAAVDNLGRFWIVGRNLTVFRKSPGQPWSRVSVPGNGDLNDIMFTSCSQGYIVGDKGLILHSPDDGNSWNLLTQPFSGDLNGVTFFDKDMGYIVGEDGLIMETQSSGKLWLRHYTGFQDTFNWCWFSPSGHALVVGNDSVLESFSNGHNSSWARLNPSNHVIAMAPQGQYAALSNGGILDTLDGNISTGSTDSIYSFSDPSENNVLLGAGQFGRIVKLTTQSTDALKN